MATAGVTIAPTFLPGFPAAMVNFAENPQAFTLGSPALWQYPGQYFGGVGTKPWVLKLPANLQNELTLLAGQPLDFTLMALSAAGESPQPVAVQNYAWAVTAMSAP